ncbi:AAEL007809-PA [Aedes aegypti]|uniref:Dol-P-Glc:Glc(2)Man(9)GlcNAc(2)-PP-Dol alpha-1,2-glucosyltransferase n=2 Tax=Aedes aegypti TaxID=7159 RepID=A0A1S4FHK6_AEDAE|nr:putative Dol-P-Glc:Glc(2)Man(9)GlcNAc(2)-PP-Dol alpha-1,2-glucosyltransferase [Aedes aegypti]EAT40471.1 AAEL007809-PA [Aedes aegypti]
MKNQFIFFAFISVYSAISLILFNLVYRTSKVVVDEEFHLRQGEHYCHGRFDVWDNKITTFPGLYLVSASFLGPFQACSIYHLRMISLIASIANVYLIYIIRRVVLANRSPSYLLLESISLATLPPLYFFTHLYYTDVLSVTMVLTMVYFSLKGMHNWGGIAAFMAILMRQTNIVWVGMVLGNQVIKTAIDLCQADGKGSNRKGRHYGYSDLWQTIRIMLRKPKLVVDLLRHVLPKYFGYIINIVGFVVFLCLNGSIVIGDKSAHVAKLHVPQIFYFSLFFAAFSSSHVLSTLKRIARFMRKKWPMTILCICLFAAAIHLNTIVHPYMLADNRHYTFYIWNRFFGRWWFARYLPIPVYYAALVLVVLMLLPSSNNHEQTVGFSLLWMLATIASVALQQLIEVRYFILPFLVLRLIQTNVRTSSKLLALEVLANLAINAATVYVFVKKEFYWSNYEDAQRIIW